MSPQGEPASCINMEEAINIFATKRQNFNRVTFLVFVFSGKQCADSDLTVRQAKINQRKLGYYNYLKQAFILDLFKGGR